ncbi:hypothetical protein RJ639_034453 [Escallonia herrerae]|uniref:Transposase (putative) gypsy type domain-containing protein n=1 Tax=Escallonia herrerae TaxID=1293975 RepID=A0AA88X221_9ASTE|nr:hypothetical protein RJ639_034453 [Escallonia herrerae]
MGTKLGTLLGQSACPRQSPWFPSALHEHNEDGVGHSAWVECSAKFCLRQSPWFPSALHKHNEDGVGHSAQVAPWFLRALSEHNEDKVGHSARLFEEVIKCSSSSSTGRALTSRNEAGPSNPQSSQPLPRRNELGELKDKVEDKETPQPWFTADDKRNKMTKEKLEAFLKEYPLPKGCIARGPELQEPANYGTDWETGIYEEQLKSGYRLSLHPFALKVFDHYKIVPGQLMPNGWRKLVGLVYLVETSGYNVDPTDFLKVFFELCFVKGVASNIDCGSDKALKSAFLGALQKVKGKRKEKTPFVKQPPAPKRTKVNLIDPHPRVIEGVSIDKDPIFLPRRTNKQVSILEKRLQRSKRKEAEAKEKGIQDYLDGNVGDEWLKKRTEDGLEIYELGFQKAKEIFAQRFPDIPLDYFIMPTFRFLSGETVMPSKAEDVTSQIEKDDHPGATLEP